MVAQNIVLLRPLGGARLTSALHPMSPALGDTLAATAVNSGELEGHGVGALPVTRQSGIAGALASVKAGSSVLGGDKARIAYAYVAYQINQSKIIKQGP